MQTARWWGSSKALIALALHICDLFYPFDVSTWQMTRNGKVLKFNADGMRIYLISFSSSTLSELHLWPSSLRYALTWNISTSRNVQSPWVMPSACAASINFRTKWPRTDSMTTVNFNHSVGISDTRHRIHWWYKRNCLTSGVHAGISQIIIVRFLFVAI